MNALRVSEVFVPGGLPTVTYDARANLHLEERVRDYLDERHRILSVSGPTKTGKTVLLRSIIEDPVWIAGGAVDNIETFWAIAADQLGVATEEHDSDSMSDGRETTNSVGGGIAIARGESSRTETFSSDRSTARMRSRPVAVAAAEALSSNLRCLVIDDFHFISPDVQLRIVRGLKALVFDGLPVVFASVPHRAYDAVRVEREMTGRVEQLPIAFWSIDELVQIANRGFAALNLEDPGGGIAKRLAQESFSSPHLMQDLSRQACKLNGVRERPEMQVRLSEPGWYEFFNDRANDASRSTYDVLARGPRQRTDRKERTLTSGEETDIYGLVLAAIARTGPKLVLPYEELRAAIREIGADEPPQRHEVTRVIDEMVRIAREQIEGEPVLDYDDELSTLYLSDPYLAYYLRWGRW